MNSKFIHAKYLAVLLLGIVFLIMATVDAFSTTLSPSLANALSASLTIND